MNPITFEAYQAYLKLKYHHAQDATGLFMKLVEEVGETAEALNKIDGRKFDDGVSSLQSELADIIHYTLAIASFYNIDLSKEILSKDRIASVKYQQTPNLEQFINGNTEG